MVAAQHQFWQTCPVAVTPRIVGEVEMGVHPADVSFATNESCEASEDMVHLSWSHAHVSQPHGSSTQQPSNERKRKKSEVKRTRCLKIRMEPSLPHQRQGESYLNKPARQGIWILPFFTDSCIIPFVTIGASYNGSTTVSKTVCVGSIPPAPAKKYPLYVDIFCLKKHP